MNDETRKALMEVIEAELDSYCPSPFNGAFTVSLVQIIDRLLADRAVPEPDAVHAVHEALVNSAPDWMIDREDGELFDMARAALQAAAEPEPDTDAIYRECNQVVAALSKCFYSWIGTVDDAEPGWTKAVYIDLPSGQVSWHVPDHEIPDLFGHLQESGEPWDGHTTEEKYERLAALAAVPTVQADPPEYDTAYAKGYQDGQAATGTEGSA